MKTAFFPPRTLAQLPADNLEALAVLSVEFEKFDGHARQMPEHHDDYVEALSILKGFAMVRDAKLELFPELGPQRHQNISNIQSYFTKLRTAVREFSETDFKRVMDLTNELRDLIRTSTLISEEHKRRLLRRLEAMRGEFHRKTNDIDRFWGFIGEAGIAMRKFGQDLAPITERVLELGGIVVSVIFAKEGIKALPEVSQILLPNE